MTPMRDLNPEHIRQFRFRQLFVDDLGWDRPAQPYPYSVEVGGAPYSLEQVAHKRGVQILHCQPDAQGLLPPYAVRQSIERKATDQVREHLIIFTDAGQHRQVWQWVSRLSGKTAQYREIHFHAGETPELLAQKLGRLRFTLDEEELLTVLGVTRRMDDTAPRDKVTKKFYGEFAKQRQAFAAFIDGIPADSEDQRWYTAVVIDRLMFLWFLQEKKFLDGQSQYLQSRLASHLAAERTQSFYKAFLSPLFFKGFALERTPSNRAAIAAEFGDVPYLNGGLFAQHELEQHYGDALDIADHAFEKLFAFFDEWEWHLDERPLKSGKEINPDVLGYIFEKFVNQKQMGAYYTKEDITEYIGKNTIIPSLLGKVRAEHPTAFDALAWTTLQHSGDRYIYPAMLKGVDAAYPADIAAGLDTEAPDLLARRKPWNKRAHEAVSLPTEIWRETIARHERTRDVRTKLAAGEVREVGDLITFNLNIRQFAQDLIEHCTDVALLKSFWFNLAGRLPRHSNEKFRHGLSVLDPTCGSGAFLFAALNILKPLYDATLRTLQAVRTDALIAGHTSHREKWAEVDELLNRFALAGSERAQDYAVTKHIVVHNLYGVDIEKQATEIAKLRLFLKLVALLEPGDAIEPLPDIDFNIRHGNALVGYATADETEAAVKGATQANLLFSDAWEDIRIRLSATEQQYNNFQIQQVQRGGHVSLADKQALVDSLRELESLLNYHLAKQYGVDPTKPRKYEPWQAAHQPFHWYVDFHSIMASGGFDAVVGNPPWKEYAAIKAIYQVVGYASVDCGNLYGLCTERALNIAGQIGSVGFIVQLPIASASRMHGLRSYIENGSKVLWVSTFDDRPGKLFDGLQHCRSTIFIAQKGAKQMHKLLCSRYQRWQTAARFDLLHVLSYLDHSNHHRRDAAWPKIDQPWVASALNRVSHYSGQPIETYRRRSPTAHYVYYQEASQYWIKATTHIPYYAKNGLRGDPPHGRWLYFDSDRTATIVAAAMNSSLFYCHFVAFSDCFHLPDGLVSAFRLPGLDRDDSGLVSIGRELMQALEYSAIRKNIVSRQGALMDRIEYDEYSIAEQKEFVDLIDKELASRLALTQLELDAILSFDLKFRMGSGDQND